MAVEVTVIKSTAVDPTLLQDIVTAMPNWFQQGGIVMWLLLFTSFLVTIVTLERAFLWLTYPAKKEHFLLNNCFAALNKKEKEQALINCQSLDTPVLNMLSYGIDALPFSPKEKMEAYAQQQIANMSQGQSLLRSAVIIAILLGFLGTTLGLIDSFVTLAQQGDATLSSLLGVVALALISFSSGLCVALFSVIPYKVFQVKINKLNQRLHTISGEFHHICQQKKLITNQLSDIMQLQEARMNSEATEKVAVADQSEMPYHYEFKQGSDVVNVSLHKEMKDLQTTSQSSLMDMYKDELIMPEKNRKKKNKAHSSLFEMYKTAVDEDKELYGVNEVELQKQQETAQLKQAK